MQHYQLFQVLARELFGIEHRLRPRLGRGAALGRLVIAVLGDGSHMFGNPVAIHHASAAHKLPVLFVVTELLDAGRGAARCLGNVSRRRGGARQQAPAH